MQSEQQQRIMGYFIEEAKDHLNTIEQGLLSLQSTIEDAEMVSELFRAAHSVKGGAAMLGLGSIQKTAHRLEDYFKVLKECPIKVDQKLESFFLRVFDTLQELIEQLQGPFGLTDDKAQEVMAEVEPVFNSLNDHLGFLVNQAGGTPPEDVELGGTPTTIPMPVDLPRIAVTAQEESALQLIFQSDIPARLREMLQLFKQADNASTRQQLQNICQLLAQAGEQFDLPHWVALLDLAERAIANPDNSYRTLAPILIKDIKQSQELVLTHRADAIQPSIQLQALAPLAIEDEPMDDFTNLLDAIDFEDDSDSTPGFIEFDVEADEPFSARADDGTTPTSEPNWFTEGTFIQPDIASTLLDFGLDSDASDIADLTPNDLGLGDELNSTSQSYPLSDRNGPEVGLAELNSLADLFEGEVPDLGLTWQAEEVVEDSSTELFAAAPSNDFSDLLMEQDDLEDLDLENDRDETDLSDLLNTAERSSFVSDSARLESSPTHDPAELSSQAADFPFTNSFDSGEDDPFASLTNLQSPLETASSNASGLEDLGELFLNLEEGEFAHLGSEAPSNPLESNVAEAIALPDSSVNPFGILADPFEDDSSGSVANLGSDNLNDPFALDSSDLGLDSDFNLNFSEDDFFNTPEDGEPLTFDPADLGRGESEIDSPNRENLEILEDLAADDALIESLIQQENDSPPTDSLTTLQGLTSETDETLLEPFGASNAFDAWAALDAEEELELPLVEDSVVSEPDVTELDLTSDLWGDAIERAIAPPPADVSPDPLDDPFGSIDLSDSSASFGLEALTTEDIDFQSEFESLNFSLDSDELQVNELRADELRADELSGDSDPFDLLWDDENLDKASATIAPDLTDALEATVTDQSLEVLFADDTVTDQSLEVLFADDIDSPQSFDLTIDEFESESVESAPLTVADSFSAPSDWSDLLDAETELAALLTDDLATDGSDDLSGLFDEEDAADSNSLFADLSLDLSDSAKELDSSSDLPNLFEDSSLFEDDASAFDQSLLDAMAAQPLESNPSIEDLSIEVDSSVIDSAELELSNLDSLESGNLPIDTLDEPELSFTSPEPEEDLFNSEDLSNDALVAEAGTQADEASDLTFDFDAFEVDSQPAEISGLELDFDLPEITSESEGSSELEFDFDSFLTADETSGAIAESIPDLDISDLDSSDLAAPEEAIADLDAAMFEFDPQPDLSSLSTDIASLEILDLGEQTLEMDEALSGVTLDEDAFAVMLMDAEADADSGFNELDALLSGELAEPSKPEETEDSVSFDDLEALLEQSLSGLEGDERLDFSNATAVEYGSSDHFTITDSDDFTDLDALLAGDLSSLEEPTTDIPSEEEEFDDLDLLLSESSMSPPIAISTSGSVFQASGSSEFDDLEKLLEDADQTLGGPPTTRGARGPSLPPSRSKGVRPTRGVLSDQTMRVSVKNLDNLNNLVGELVVNRNSLEQAEERLRQFLDNLLYQVQQLGDVGQRMRDLYERSLLESSLLSSRKSYQTSPPGNAGTSQSSHITGASFDALEMDRFTGFHTLSQEMIELIVRVRESASDIDFVVDETDQVTRNFRQITTQLQEGLTRSRMVPFAQTADRLPRAVRDISLQCGKQAELAVEGRDTLIDKMILEQLYDPMTHLVNNAITHGIETPEERSAAGKPSIGRIIVRTFHQGNQTVISVSDDGAGINPEFVKRKAIERGLITSAEASSMARLDVYDLLFHHGFSTKDKADDFAGRGVGMDVVRTSLNEIRGVVNIDSTVGRGTTFTIRLPLTLSISKALCCISNRARIAFPMDGVEDMLDVPKERIQRDSQDRPCIQWRDQLLPFQPLSELLRYNRNLGRGSVYGGNQEDDIVSVVVLRSNAGNYLALQVDQVLGEQEIVIKQLEGPVPKPIGVAGATVLGDGRIMPIADVLELIDLSLGRIRRESGSSLWEKDDDQMPPEVLETKTEPTVLIVDDSITVRELLSMTFNKIGYRVEQARDGQEAWEKLRSGLPCDLVFCDIEMPRMDGLELLSRIQKDPTLAHLPIAMLTSRGADRHRQMAIQLGAKGYFTKPYLEEALLDAAQRMLKGEVLVNAGS